VNTYLIPLSTAAMVFPLVAAILTIPYVLYSYRRYGSISILRSLILFSFLFYLQCAYYLAILPLPDPALVAEQTGPYYQLIPFYFVYDAFANSPFDLASPRGWLSLLTSSYVYVPAFNLLLTLPFGLYLAYYFKARLRTVLILTFALSLFFELTQLSGLFGVYPRPYRLADVDDLILNTLGGLAGYFIYTRFLHFLPSREWIDQKSVARSASVGYLRRFAAFFVDSVLVGLVSWLIMTALKTSEPLIGVAVLLLYYPLFALPTRGWTPGKALVRIRLKADATAHLPLWLLLLIRYLARNLVLLLYQFFTLLMRSNDTGVVTSDARWLGILSLVVVVFSALFLLDFLLSFRAKRKKRLWYELLSKTHNTSTLNRQ
jgi:glycopeptide antibiotics resistance protein